MKTTVRVIAVIGLLFFTLLVVISFFLSGMSDSATSGFELGPVFLLMVLPFLYLAYCLYSTLGQLKGRALLISGIIAHAAILPLVVITLRSISNAFIGIGILLMIAAWFGMYFEDRIKRTALGTKYMAVRGRFWQIIFIVAVLAFIILFIMISLL